MTRVAITGVGAITPLGVGAGTLWEALLAGRMGVTNERTWLEAELPGFAKLRTNLAGRVKDYDLLADEDFAFGAVLTPRMIERELSRSAVLAIRACTEALDSAGLMSEELRVADIDNQRFAIMLGSGVGGATALRRVGAELERNKRPHSTQMYQLQPDNPTVVVKRLYGARGPSLDVSQACASGGIGIALAAMMLERGDVDVVVAGGAEALDPSLVALFEATGAANHTEDPTDAVRPLDVNAGGAILAEAAGALVLERVEHAEARGVTVRGFVDASAITGGAGSPSLMDEEGLVRAMTLALGRSSIGDDATIAVSPHATGTSGGDKIEAQAIVKLADPRVRSVFPSKGTMGHSIGASGAIEAVISTLVLEHGVIPPAPTTPEPLAELKGLVPPASSPQQLEVDAVVSNSMGFGDQTVALVLRRAD